MSFFVYRALTPFMKRIRLIHLQPRNDRASSEKSSVEQQIRVSCTISHVSLAQPPPYTALSYTWGDVKQKSLILVGESPFYVTTSLEVVLHHLTPEDGPLTLWIDALCIDQSDDVEKTEQVQQMQEIYAQATAVITWLGTAAENSDVAMRWIQHYGSLAHKFGIGTKLDLRLGRLLQTLESDPDKLPHEELREFLQDISTQLSSETDDNDNIRIAVSKILTRPYWSRVWVVQELVHAKFVQFMCGNMIVDEEPLHQSMRLLRNFGLHQHLKSVQHPQAIDEELPSSSIDIRNAINIFKVRRAVGPFPLMYLIRSVRYFKATDPRDRIFALLSFAADAEAFGLRPDYQKSYREVYLKATLALLKNGFFDVLSLCEVEEGIPEHPSWVPDFTKTSYRATLQQRAMNRAVAPVTTVLQPKFSASGDNQIPHVSYELTQASSMALLLHAKLVGEVKRVGTTWEPQAFQRWLEELMEFSRPESTPLESDHMRAVWRTAVADQETRKGNQKPRLSENLLEQVHSTLKSLDLSAANPQTFAQMGIGDYLYQLQDIAHGRRPFCTSNGHIGIGSSVMAPGDLLYAFMGADVLYILRPDSHGKLRLIGEAYAHGMMDGEVLKDNLPADVIAIY